MCSLSVCAKALSLKYLRYPSDSLNRLEMSLDWKALKFLCVVCVCVSVSSLKYLRYPSDRLNRLEMSLDWKVWQAFVKDYLVQIIYWVSVLLLVQIRFSICNLLSVLRCKFNWLFYLEKLICNTAEVVCQNKNFLVNHKHLICSSYQIKVANETFS